MQLDKLPPNKVGGLWKKISLSIKIIGMYWEKINQIIDMKP